MRNSSEALMSPMSPPRVDQPGDMSSGTRLQWRRLSGHTGARALARGLPFPQQVVRVPARSGTPVFVGEVVLAIGIVEALGIPSPWRRSLTRAPVLKVVLVFRSVVFGSSSTTLSTG